MNTKDNQHPPMKKRWKINKKKQANKPQETKTIILMWRHAKDHVSHVQCDINNKDSY